MKAIIQGLLIAVLIAGCLEGPTGPKGEKGEDGTQIVSWTHLITSGDITYKEANNYEIIIHDDRFVYGNWYDIWLVGTTEAQIHLDTFSGGSNMYGMAILISGTLKFNYLVDITGYKLLIFTNE